MPEENRVVAVGEELDKSAKRRMLWVEKIGAWSRGELRSLSIHLSDSAPHLTDTLEEFDGVEAAAEFDHFDGAYNIEITPTMGGKKTRLGLDALISPEDGSYCYIGWLIDDGGDPESAKGMKTKGDAFGEFADGKWQNLSTANRGHAAAIATFDTYLELIARRIEQPPRLDV